MTSTVDLPVVDEAHAIPHLVCGCAGTHRAGCLLGDAEDIAVRAAAAAVSEHPIVAALRGLDDAGLLQAVDVDTEVDLIEGILDMLLRAGALGTPAVVTVVPVGGVL